MNWNGSWWNPDYAGEGFSIHEYAPGIIELYYYTYDSAFGNQLWLIAVGDRDGDHAVLDASITHGGLMGSPFNHERVTEEVWGTIELVEAGDDRHLIVTVSPVGQPSFIQYPVQRVTPLSMNTAGPWPQFSESEPPMQKLVQWDRLHGPFPGIDIGGDPFGENPNVLYGSVPTDVNDINPRTAIFRYRLTVLPHSPDIVITHESATDDPAYDYNSEILGVAQGTVLHPGDVRVVELLMGPGPAPVNWVQSHFFIDSSEGVLMNTSAQVADRS